jgi:hypothetical protein
VHDHPVGVADVEIDAVLDLAVAAPRSLVLVEDRLPDVVVGDAVMNDQSDGHGFPFPGA